LTKEKSKEANEEKSTEMVSIVFSLQSQGTHPHKLMLFFRMAQG
jgi:hypothetical protein